MEAEHVVILLTAVLLCVAATSALSGLIRVAAPLLLVVIGGVVGFLPGVPSLEVDPEWILIGVLPPLLFSAAASMPAMSFRREFRSIAGLSVVLVVLSSLLLGWFFSASLDISLAWGIALGAIVSPTDAVATAIARRVGVPQRVLTMLEGESLLNDASALVLLRSAIAAAAGGIALGGVVLDFLWAVTAAALIGFGVGWLHLWLRSKLTETAPSTVISYAAPFMAAVPAEQLGASGLVAAVVAGLISGYGAPRLLSPWARLSDSQNWKTVELVLESGIFLLMGLQLHGLITHSDHNHSTALTVAWVAAVGWLGSVLIRGVYVVSLVTGMSRRTQRRLSRQERMNLWADYLEQRLANPDAVPEPPLIGGPQVPADPRRAAAMRKAAKKAAARGAKGKGRRSPWSPERITQVLTRVRRERATIDYLVSNPIGPREGGLLVWAGMRGAVSLAAAQTLPSDTPGRPMLLLVAFALAGGSLLVQGATLPLVVRWLSRPATDEDRQGDADERDRLFDLMRQTAEQERARESGRGLKRVELDVLQAQRTALLDARDDGVFDAEVLSHALAVVDAEQIGLELRGSPEDG
ncbi:cation:proton antiporter [Micropruina sp.]|uniref:cation:proton antiporter n=1 Tax=Micropruina sp. TaxID=2737536 RepID=UPI0039E6F4BE